MIQLRTLGALDLRDSDGRALAAVMAQPKRLAVLTYLALASPDGFLRRDTLVGLFWGESDEGRARAALRQALRYLRRSLGDEVIVSRGEEEVGIGSGMLSCDVLELRSALSRGDDAAGVALYRGDLLPDFHVVGAPVFDRWLEAERRDLRAAAGAAVVRLATAAEACDDFEAATRWMRRAVDLAPTDELVARRLMGLLEQTGNRAAAATVYEHLVERLRRELDVEPSPLTETAMTEIRSRPPRTRGCATSLDATPHASGGSGLQPRRVLVTVFENRTGEPALDALGRLAADWLAQGLALVQDLEVVPPAVAMGLGRRATELTREADAGDSVPALAEATGAGIVVSGAYYLDGPDTRFQARITDAIQGQLIPAPGWVPVKRSDPLTGFEALRERVAIHLAPRLSPRAVHVQRARQAPAYEAYRLYMEGLEFFIRADWAGSLACFRQSAALDRGYALPRIVCTIAHWNLGQLDQAKKVADEASAYRDTLGAFERAVLDMVLAWLRGDWVASYDAARRQADLAPGSIPHFQVAEEARRLKRPHEARAVLSRLDPTQGELQGFVFYWLELATAHHMLGDHARELEVAQRARRLYQDHPIATLLEVRALAALGLVDALHRLVHHALATPDQREPRAGALLREAALELQAHGHAGRADPFVERCLEWHANRPHDRRDSAAQQRELARTLYLAGEWRDAERLFRDLVNIGPQSPGSIAFHHGHLQGHLDEGYLAVLAVRRGDQEDVERWCRCLEGLKRPFLYGSQWLWLAAVAALQGDRERAGSRLGRAFAEGRPYELCLHTEPHLGLLRGDALLDALLAPRG